MNKCKIFHVIIILIGIILLHADALGQQRQSKVGLCLSGGGARGLAHIGLLKIIDSLGIKIDYITGTSMGSVVGALYASGYSGKQIDSIAREAQWEKLLSRYVQMDEIFIDEKDEYMRYITELPINKKKLNFTGLIDGYELLNLFSKLTLPVAHIKDFNKLPIPFHCMAVDIISVQPIEISSGNLALAMRASMSIPTIFNPVKLNDYLLVDGGLLENFPVEQLKKMGAEFIIGSYTGGKLYTEKELITIDKILVQSSLYYSIERASTLEKQCNIMNNLTNGMGAINAGSFNRSFEILDSGDAISAKCLPALVELAQVQRRAGIVKSKRTNVNPLNDTLRIGSIKIEGINTQATKEFAESRVSKMEGKFVTALDLEKTGRNLYGSRNFSSVYYELFPSNEGIDVIMNAQEDYKVRVKPAIHFDSERGAGIILNATFRNVLGPKSRFLLTADFAEAPKLRAHYRRYFKQSNWSFNALVFGERAEQKLYEDRTGKTSDLYTNKFLFNFLGVSFALNPSSLFSFGFQNELGSIQPKLATNFTVESYINQFGLFGYFQHNTLDQPYYSKKGLDVYVSSKLPYWAYQNVAINQTTVDSFLNETDITKTAKITNQPYLKNSIRINYFMKVNRKFTINVAIYEGLTFSNILNRSSNILVNDRFLSSSIPINDFFFLGGTDQRSRPYLIGLAGLKEGELAAENFNILKLGFQFEPIHKLFLTAYSQYYTTASSPIAMYKNLFKWQTDFNLRKDENGEEYASLLNFCGSIGYQSPLGPINIFVSKASFLPVWRVYFSFGFKF